MSESSSLSTISFRDEQFLMAEGLNPSNVLEYFYQSQFYSLTDGHSSINEMIRRGSIAPSASSRIDGSIYMLVSANAEGESGLVDASVFVIQKFQQIVNRPRVPLQVFHIVSGNIYLSPGLGNLIERHLEIGIAEFEDMIDNIRLAVNGTPKDPMVT